jgi:uncharacterized protein (TIGR04255 family)
MPSYPHLTRAPITEALIDIQVEPRPGLALTELDAFKSAVQASYPNLRTRHDWVTQLQVGPEGVGPVEQRSSPSGYLLTSSDQKQVVQGRLNGFSFSRLAPYTSWNEIRKESLQLWELYLRLAEPKRPTRVGLRYINRIDIPLPVDDFRDYLPVAPEIVPALPQSLISFFSRVVLPFMSVRAIANITMAGEPPKEPAQQVYPVIFDIDVWKLWPEAAGFDQVFSELDRLRDTKNQIFFENLTPRAIGLFE